MNLGLYIPDCPPDLRRITWWEKQIKARIKIVSWYQAWGSCYAKCIPEFIQEVQSQGRIPMITWEPWKLPEEIPTGQDQAEQKDFALKEILAGTYDQYILEWAKSLASTRKQVYLRPMHEMNGFWYPWAGCRNSNNPQEYIRAWKYLRNLFKHEKAYNVIWVWSPMACSYPDTPENSIDKFFPGENEVDWLAMDGYNWGTTQPAWPSYWQSLEQIFLEGYKKLKKLAPNKPIMLAEIGCAEQGGSKAEWIKDSFKDLTRGLLDIGAIVWFNIDKECNWRIDSSGESLLAFRKDGWIFK